MALDGMFLYQLRQELAEKALGARVDRIHQPAREEIIIALRWKGGAGKLLLSANAGSPVSILPKQRRKIPNSRLCSACCCASIWGQRG